MPPSVKLGIWALDRAPPWIEVIVDRREAGFRLSDVQEHV